MPVNTRVQDAITHTRFWDMLPSQALHQIDDGLPWVVETRRGAQYHAVMRISPQSGPYRELSDALLRVAELSQPEQPRTAPLPE